MTKRRSAKAPSHQKPIRRQLPFYIKYKGKNTYLIIVLLPSGDQFGMLIKHSFFESPQKHAFKDAVLNNKKRGSKRRTISGIISPGRNLIQPLLPKGFCAYHDLYKCA